MPDTVETLLARIDERTETIISKMDAHCTQLGDHEKRIGGLEGFRTAVYIVSAVIVALAGLALATMEVL